jgi:hypothetical protein
MLKMFRNNLSPHSRLLLRQPRMMTGVLRPRNRVTTKMILPPNQRQSAGDGNQAFDLNVRRARGLRINLSLRGTTITPSIG